MDKIDPRDIQIRDLICHRERLKNDIDKLQAVLQQAQDKMKNILVTEGYDAGVILVSDEAVMVEAYPGIHVYQNDYFSPLGDALMEVYNIISKPLPE